MGHRCGMADGAFLYDLRSPLCCVHLTENQGIAKTGKTNQTKKP